MPTKNNYETTLTTFCDAVKNGGADVAQYTNSLYGIHANALKNTFPTVKQRLAEKIFAALAHVYAQNNVARQWDINVYGETFADFIFAQTQGPRAKHYNWQLLAQIAHIEYAITLTYYDDTQDNNDLQERAIPALTYSTQNTDAGLVQDLQENHRYADIDPLLQLNHPVTVRRNDLRIIITNGH